MVSRKIPEGRIKAACLRYLEKRGITAWNNPSGAVRIAPDRWLHFGKKGSADILGCLPGGRFLAVEVKAARGDLSPEQKTFLAEIRELGGPAVMVRDWRELDAELWGAGYTLEDMRYSSVTTLFNRGRREYGKTI
jgi:hypothetical protein